MPVRSFAPSGFLDMEVGDAGITGNFSLAALVYFLGPGSEFIYSGITPSGATINYACGREGNRWRLYRAGGSNGPKETPTGQWLLCAVTKASGTVKPKFYTYSFETEEWTAEEGNEVIANGEGTFEKLRIGRWGLSAEQFTGKLAAIAVWNRVLTQEEVEAMTEVGSIAAWTTIGPSEPVAKWTFHQESVEEAVSDSQGPEFSEQITESGTSVVEEEPPIPYEGGGGGSPPETSVQPATEVKDTTARLNGVVEAKGLPTDYWFEYGEGDASLEEETFEYNVKVPVGEDGDGGESSGELAVFENVTGLKPGTTYSYRLMAKNGAGETEPGSSGFFVFETDAEEAEPPEALTEAASGVTSTTATLNGKVDRNGPATDWWFEYGLTEALGSKTGGGVTGPGGTPVGVGQGVTGLTPSTKYYFRLVVENENGEDKGTILNFTTGAAPAGQTVKVKVGGSLIDAARYVKAGGSLVPA